jgi:hypothetical protein
LVKEVLLEADMLEAVGCYAVRRVYKEIRLAARINLNGGRPRKERRKTQDATKPIRELLERAEALNDGYKMNDSTLMRN